MNKYFRTIFYSISFGLSTVIILWIVLANRLQVYIPVNIGLIAMYVLLFCAFLTACFLGIRELIQKPKTAKVFVIGFGILALLILIGFILDDAEVLKKYAKFGVESSIKSRIIGGSLFATWVILGGTVALALFSSILDFIKKS